MLAAFGLVVSPTVSNAAASSLSIARAAPQLGNTSLFQDDENHHASTEVIIGVLLLVAIGIGAIAGNNSGNPLSP
jgi:hypothetical protein